MLADAIQVTVRLLPRRRRKHRVIAMPSRPWTLATAATAVLAPLLASLPGHATADGTGPGPDPAPSVSQVVVISIDGLNPTALTRLGRRGTPELHRMMRRGASTLNARTAYELTVTLPNHTSMVTGRRIAVADGGHGVTWNDDRIVPRTVHTAAGEGVESVFTTVHATDRSTALFASKTKFSLWQRSWPDAIDRFTVRPDNARLTDVVRRDVEATDRALTFVHLSEPDVVGHATGWMTKPYLDAVRRADTRVGRILDAIDQAGESGRTLVVVLSDHGGKGRSHADPGAPENYRIPFLVMGPDVPPGTDLYALNPDYRDPRRGRPTYDVTSQPIRNGAVANLVTDVLGLPAVTDSQVDAAQDLDVYAAP
jgi:hypothetical protein